MLYILFLIDKTKIEQWYTNWSTGCTSE